MALDPVANCTLIARLDGARTTSPRGLSGEAWGADDPSGAGLAAACFWGGSVVPVGSAEALPALAAELAAEERSGSVIVGSAEAVAAVWPVLRPGWGAARSERLDQPLLTLGRVPEVRADPAVRVVRRTSWNGPPAPPEGGHPASPRPARAAGVAPVGTGPPRSASAVQPHRAGDEAGHQADQREHGGGVVDTRLQSMASSPWPARIRRPEAGPVPPRRWRPSRSPRSRRPARPGRKGPWLKRCARRGRVVRRAGC